MTHSRRAAATALALLLALVGGIWLSPAASAHDDEATLELESELVDDAGPLSLDLRVSARYSEDDHLVASATMSVTGTGPDGATLAETPLEPVAETEGLYGAELDFSVGGSWSLQVSSTDPEGELTVTVEIPDDTDTTTDDDTSTSVTLPTDGDAIEADDDDLLPILLGVAAVVVLGVVVVALVLRRRKAAGIDDEL